MPHSSTHPDFTVVVDGGFDEAGRWAIVVQLCMREGLSREAESQLRPSWSSVARQGIALERSRGAALGARSFRVRLARESPGRIRRTRTRPKALEA